MMFNDTGYDYLYVSKDTGLYELCKADSGAIRFQVRCVIPQVCLAFTGKESHAKHIFKVLLGPEIQIMNSVDEIVTRALPRNLARITNEYQEFWATWYNGILRIGNVCQMEKPLIQFSYKSDSTNIIGFIKFYKTSERCNVDWKFEAPPVITKPNHKILGSNGQLRWVKMINDQLPPDALVGGFQNEPTYIARAYHNRSLCPGVYVPSNGLAFIPWGYRNHPKSDFEILCGYNAVWVKTKNNYIPGNAFVGGYSEVRRQPLYIGRAMYEGNLITGKVHVLYKLCYIPYRELEIEMQSYEILVLPDLTPRGVMAMQE